MNIGITSETVRRLTGSLEAIHRRVQKLEGAAERVDERNWTRRVQLLEGVYEACGKRLDGFDRAGVSHSVAYYHRDRSPLFAELLNYVTAAGKSWYREKHTWGEFWPALLDQPGLLEVAGVEEPLKPRLINLGLITTEEAYPSANEEGE